MAIVNQKNPSKTVWKESSICTKTWSNSVVQFMKVSDMLEADAGFLMRDTVVFICEILDCCPWFEFHDLEVLVSEDDQESLTTDPDELIDSDDDSEGLSGDEGDMFRNLLSRAGFHLTYGDNYSQPKWLIYILKAFLFVRRRHMPQTHQETLRFDLRSTTRVLLDQILGLRIFHLCLLRLYQFEPARMNSHIVARILIKAVMAMPALDFSLCLFLEQSLKVILAYFDFPVRSFVCFVM